MWEDIKAKIEEITGQSLVAAGIKLVVALLLIIVGFKIINKIVKSFSNKKIKKDVDKTAKSFVASFLSLTLKTLLVITAAAIIGIPMSSIVAVIGSAGIAIGLALQGGLSNLAGGVIITFMKPFSVGDYIFISSAGVEGTVSDIGVMYTQLVTWDNKKIVVPNSQVTSATVTDYTCFPLRRIDLAFSVGYSSDIDKVKSILMKIANDHKLVLKDPTPDVVLAEQGQSALIFKIRWWTKTEDYWTAYFEINELVKKAFDANGIKIPFPQLDVHFDKEEKNQNENI